MVKLFVRPDKPIRNAAQSARAVYRVSAVEGELLDLPSAGAQRVTMAEDRRSATIEVDINEAIPAAEADSADPALLAPSVTIDTNDELIRRLAERALLGARADGASRAEALRLAAHRHIIQKGLSTAFASASETVRRQAGDCSEHAVLLCALLRASEIPARIAIGLVYAEEFAGDHDIFGWHMWTQALVDGRWIDLDATTRRRFHAAHILTSTSTLADDALTDDLARMMSLMGNLGIEVVEVSQE
jgi:transglutaminase-like putative cysteine protease